MGDSKKAEYRKKIRSIKKIKARQRIGNNTDIMQARRWFFGTLQVLQILLLLGLTFAITQSTTQSAMENGWNLRSISLVVIFTALFLSVAYSFVILIAYWVPTLPKARRYIHELPKWFQHIAPYILSILCAILTYFFVLAVSNAILQTIADYYLNAGSEPPKPDISFRLDKHPSRNNLKHNLN